MAQSDRSKVRKRRILKIGHKTRVFIPKKIRQLKNIILGVFSCLTAEKTIFWVIKWKFKSITQINE